MYLLLGYMFSCPRIVSSWCTDKWQDEGVHWCCARV